MNRYKIDIVVEETSKNPDKVLDDGFIFNQARFILKINSNLNFYFNDRKDLIEGYLTVVALYSGAFEPNQHIASLKWGVDYWKIEKATLTQNGFNYDVTDSVNGEIQFKLWEAYDNFLMLNKIEV